MESNKSSSPAELLVETKIKRTKRDVPPAHYILKIESFSEFLDIVAKIKDKKYESKEFEAGGYTWKMVVYPRGNTKGNGEGHVSMYIASTDKKAISNGCHVNTLVTFFVYDHIRDKYLTIQDGEIKGYHVLKTEHGFDQLLPLVMFNDSSNGYLVNNCCALGAEVHVIENTIQGSVFSVSKDPPNASFTWKIDNFSTLQDQYYDSGTFNIGGYKWYLTLYPKGNGEEIDKSLSLFLALHNGDAMTGHGVYAQCKVLIKDQRHGKHHERTLGNNWFGGGFSTKWGNRNFMPLSDLENESKGFLVCDSLVVEAKMIRISKDEDLF